MKKLVTSKHRYAKLKWMPCPQDENDFPGLAYLSSLDELIIAKKKDNLHDIISKTGIGFTVFNNTGQKVFLAIQEKRWKTFNVKIFNIYGNEIIVVKKLFSWCFNDILVWAPPGNFIGSVKQVKTFKNTFIVENNLGKTVFQIKANSVFQFEYKIILADEEIGSVSKKWRNTEITSAKQFGIRFPINLQVTDKAVLLAACFLI